MGARKTLLLAWAKAQLARVDWEHVKAHENDLAKAMGLLDEEAPTPQIREDRKETDQ